MNTIAASLLFNFRVEGCILHPAASLGRIIRSILYYQHISNIKSELSFSFNFVRIDDITLLHDGHFFYIFLSYIFVYFRTMTLFTGHLVFLCEADTARARPRARMFLSLPFLSGHPSSNTCTRSRRKGPISDQISYKFYKTVK